MNQKNSNELVDLVLNGRNETLEFCDEYLDDLVIAKHLVAFANAKGGMLLFGVEENGDVEGLINHDTKFRIDDIISKSIFPAIQTEYYEVKLTGKTVGVVEIFEGSEKPHYYTSQGEQNYMIRSGKSSQKIPSNQLQTMLRKNIGDRFEISPIQNTSLDDLDQDRLAYFLQKTRGVTLSDVSDEELKTLLTRLNLIVEEDKKVNLTVAAIVLFAKKPGEILVQTQIQLNLYNGADTESETLNLSVDEPIMPVINSEDQTVVSKGAIEACQDIIHENLVYEGDEDSKPYFPENMVKELLINALAHRNYSDAESKIIVNVFTDHLEVISPGTLHKELTMAKIEVGQKATENPLLYSYLAETGYLDKNQLAVFQLLHNQWTDGDYQKFTFDVEGQNVKATLFV